MLSSRSTTQNQSVDEFKLSLEESFRSAIFAQKLAQARKSAYNAKRYTPPTYKVGDSVYLSRKLFTDSSSTVRPSQKLSVRRIGPFTVLEIINKNAVRVDLPNNISIHPVIHVEHTARAFEQHVDIRKPGAPCAEPFLNHLGESVIVVNKILAHRRRGRGWAFLTHYENTPYQEAE